VLALEPLSSSGKSLDDEDERWYDCIAMRGIKLGGGGGIRSRQERLRGEVETR